MRSVNRKRSAVRDIWIWAYDWATNVGIASASIDDKGVKEPVAEYCRRHACDSDSNRRIYQPGQPRTKRAEHGICTAKCSHLLNKTQLRDIDRLVAFAEHKGGYLLPVFQPPVICLFSQEGDLLWSFVFKGGS